MSSYTIDSSHSAVSFSVRHMVFAKVRGHFNKWTAELAFDPADPTKSSVAVEIDAASIDTREAQRDGHLKSPDFFDVEKFPRLTFRSKSVERAGDGHYKVTGALTIRDVSKDVVLDVEETGRGKDPWGNARVGFSAKATINRADFGLKWNQALEAGGVLVGEKVEIELDVQAMEKKAAA
jgi:polyisoprenoid-binding protein YceI